MFNEGVLYIDYDIAPQRKSVGSEQDWGLNVGYGLGISDETWVVSNGFTGV